MTERLQPRIRSGRFARVAMLGGMAARLAGDAASAAGRFAATAAKDEAARALHRRAAKTLTRSLGEMKGLPMKLGQMLSYIDDFVPPQHRHIYRETLRELQTRTRPMLWESIEELVTEELGGPPDTVFASFDRNPIAAASIGQVYRATTHDGVDVAVKVQYPGIADAIRSDMRNIDTVVSALATALPRFDVEQSINDLTARLHEECDYTVERDNQHAFAESWSDDPEVLIPRVVEDLCGRHVLVTEWVAGMSWHDMLASSSDEEKNRYGLTIFRFVFRSLYVFGMFNADPHPGNYLFLPDGRVAFLDFGCVQRFDPEILAAIARVRKMAVTGVRGEPFRDALSGSYGIPRELDDELWQLLEDYMYLSFEPAVSPQPYRYDKGFTERLAKMTMTVKVEIGKRLLKVGIFDTKQPGVVFLHRINFGLNSILSTLQAEADFPALMAAIDAEAAAGGPDGTQPPDSHTPNPHTPNPQATDLPTP